MRDQQSTNSAWDSLRSFDPIQHFPNENVWFAVSLFLSLPLSEFSEGWKIDFYTLLQPKPLTLIFSISGKVDEKATQLHAIASLKVLLDATKPQDNANGGAGGDTAHDSGRASQGTEVYFS